MNVQIDLNEVIRNNLSINQYVLLYLLSNEEYEMVDRLLDELSVIRNTFQKLEDDGWIKINGETTERIVLRDKANKLFNTSSKSGKIKSIIFWIEDWRKLFPPGYKGDKIGCTKKMKAFLKDYPEYSIEHIHKATELYLDEFKDTPYLSQAHYFIRKDNVSKLAAYCERLKENPNQGSVTESNITAI